MYSEGSVQVLLSVCICVRFTTVMVDMASTSLPLPVCHYHTQHLRSTSVYQPVVMLPGSCCCTSYGKLLIKMHSPLFSTLNFHIQSALYKLNCQRKYVKYMYQWVIGHKTDLSDKQTMNILNHSTCVHMLTHTHTHTHTHTFPRTLMQLASPGCTSPVDMCTAITTGRPAKKKTIVQEHVHCVERYVG